MLCRCSGKFIQCARVISLPLVQGEDASKGMAGSLADPAALLRLYVKHGRLRDAAMVALSHLQAWQSQVSYLAACSLQVWALCTLVFGRHFLTK